jgi:anti-sigma factor RsiW
MTDDDAELVALLDNELDEDRKGALLARMAADEELRARYEALRIGGTQLSASLDALLAEAPAERLRAALPAEGFASRPPGRFAGVSLRDLAAGLVIGLLAATTAAWLLWSRARTEGSEDWRSAVVEYTELYTNETFSPLHPDGPLQVVELDALGERVGANLTPEKIELPGLRFTVAFMLSFQGQPLGVIAYVDPQGSPVLLCIFANRAADAPLRSERRGELSLAWWARDGRSHLVIGRIPEERALDLAQTLQKRV